MPHLSSADVNVLELRVRAQSDALATFLAGCHASDFERRPVSGGWNAREQLAHLVRYREVFLERIGRILTEDDPRLARYRAEEDPGFEPYTHRSVESLRRRFEELGDELAVTISALSPPLLARVGTHSRFGAMTLALWIEFFLAHEGHHLYVLLQRSRDHQR